jgi:hypothetical protein
VSILSLGALEVITVSGTIFTGTEGLLWVRTVGERSKADIRREPAAAVVISPNTKNILSFSMRNSPLLQPVRF